MIHYKVLELMRRIKFLLFRNERIGQELIQKIRKALKINKVSK